MYIAELLLSLMLLLVLLMLVVVVLCAKSEAPRYVAAGGAWAGWTGLNYSCDPVVLRGTRTNTRTRTRTEVSEVHELCPYGSEGLGTDTSQRRCDVYGTEVSSTIASSCRSCGQLVARNTMMPSCRTISVSRPFSRRLRSPPLSLSLSLLLYTASLIEE